MCRIGSSKRFGLVVSTHSGKKVLASVSMRSLSKWRCLIVLLLLLIIFFGFTQIPVVLRNSLSRTQNEERRFLAKKIAWTARKNMSGVEGVPKNSTPAIEVYPDRLLRESFRIPKPRLVMGSLSNNSYADIIIGIPTVKRSGADYLISTIHSLLKNQGVNNVLVQIVVLLAETDSAVIQERCTAIYKTFKHDLESGFLQVVRTPEKYYPDWNHHLIVNFNDPKDRVKWRSKQNLDQVLLMNYIYSLFPKYYLMMEDDVLAAKGYVRRILLSAESRKDQDWLYLSFCNLGAIGKLFRIEKLPSFTSFLYLFWNKKPLDWLQADYAATLYCSYDEKISKCFKRRALKTPFIKPALFQHVGRKSSLKGKVQKLRDGTFRMNYQKKS